MREDNRENNILVAMSGGIDSSVTALLLKETGYNVKGAILRMHDAGMSAEDLINGKLPAAVWYAREASRKLRLDFNIIDVRKEFDEKVKKYFFSDSEENVGLNPDYYTRKHQQLDQMLEAAGKLGCDKVATGHYAIIERDEASGRYILKKSKDESVDQSYKLYRLGQDELSKIITPLGEYTKEEVVEIGRKAKMKNVRADDSLCFVPDGQYWAFVGKRLKELAEKDQEDVQIIGLRPGNFTDRQGKILGQHRGFLYYTVGSREGLDEDQIPEGLYVYKKDSASNEIILAAEEDLYTDTVTAHMVNFVSLPSLTGDAMRITAKLFYGDSDHPGTASMLDDGMIQVRFDDPVRAPVPGLDMVLYDNDVVVAGGLIL